MRRYYRIRNDHAGCVENIQVSSDRLTNNRTEKFIMLHSSGDEKEVAASQTPLIWNAGSGDDSTASERFDYVIRAACHVFQQGFAKIKDKDDAKAMSSCVRINPGGKTQLQKITVTVDANPGGEKICSARTLSLTSGVHSLKLTILSPACFHEAPRRLST